MKKSTSICLFSVSAALICCLAYSGGYYFSSNHIKEDKAQESIRDNPNPETDQPADSAVAIASLEYVICEEDGFLIVYYADRETVYSNTDISMDRLSAELQQEIRNGKPVYSESELYSFLESHSS